MYETRIRVSLPFSVPEMPPHLQQTPYLEPILTSSPLALMGQESSGSPGPSRAVLGAAPWDGVMRGAN